MRFPFLSLALLLIAILWPIAASQAKGSADKGPDVMTENGVRHLAPAPGSVPDRTDPGAPAVAVPAGKAAEVATALPFNPATAVATPPGKRIASPAFVPADPGARLPNVSTVLPAPAGVPPLSEEAQREAKRRAFQAAMGLPAPRGYTGALGQIPRAGWGTGQPVSQAPKTARDLTTSGPRDPNAPEPARSKAAAPPAIAKPEVRQ